MKPLKRIKAKVTSDKWPDAKPGDVISIPEFLKADFLKYKYGEIVKESPEEKETPEKKVSKRGRKPKVKE